MTGKFDMSDRRHWTLEKEDAMISILEGIVADGGRCDTSSFRSGTYEHVVLKMREKIENITITIKHVQNKMKRLKDKYSTAYDMLNTSGFGWNDTRKCVTIDDPKILTEYLKKHPNNNYTANRSFSHYERLVTVFGKDRVTGSMIESAADALDHMRLENEESDTADFTEPLSTPSNVASASSNLNTGQTSNRKGTRNVSSTVTDITKVFEKSMERASANIAKLTEAITGGDAMTRLGVELEEEQGVKLYQKDGFDWSSNKVLEMGVNDTSKRCRKGSTPSKGNVDNGDVTIKALEALSHLKIASGDRGVSIKEGGVGSTIKARAYSLNVNASCALKVGFVDSCVEKNRGSIVIDGATRIGCLERMDIICPAASPSISKIGRGRKKLYLMMSHSMKTRCLATEARAQVKGDVESPR
ncbi:hypothetical protein Ddye_023057 [Dipteronia dyeriana]|uniref:Myb/SANT-like domain-containing protein n=1 Tax=Dipteronia dyeriana TaxID=168575 RepID=A0AAD9WRS1_9ROSI|nr:hypothetical protein Ddye_023057 [Dipteronia dyeriana]